MNRQVPVQDFPGLHRPCAAPFRSGQSGAHMPPRFRQAAARHPAAVDNPARYGPYIRPAVKNAAACRGAFAYIGAAARIRAAACAGAAVCIGPAAYQGAVPIPQGIEAHMGRVHRFCRPALPVREILHRPAPGLIGVALALRVLRGGAGVASPVVEHPGDVEDGLLPSLKSGHRPQHQVEVLCAVIF